MKPDLTRIPHIWCDFNACGLSGKENDISYYSLHRERLKELNPYNGMKVFVYDNDLDDDGNPSIVGCFARLEKIEGFTSPWKATPENGEWYYGPALW